MLLAIGIVAWVACGLWAGKPHVEAADNVWMAGLAGAIYLTLGPVGLLVR
jgi:hypothetical protein